MREVLLVDKTGKVFSDVPDSMQVRHDTVAANLLKQQIDPNYQVTPQAESMYDNCQKAAELYQILAIMDDVRDLVAFFPEIVTPEQIIYFVDNFLEEEQEGVKRFHLMKYVSSRDMWKDIESKDILALYIRVMEEKQNGLIR